MSLSPLLLVLLLVGAGLACLPGNQVTVDNGASDVTNAPPPSDHGLEKDPGAGNLNEGADGQATAGPVTGAPDTPPPGPIAGGPVTGAPSSGGDACAQLQCTFEQGSLCQYKSTGKPAIPDLPAGGGALRRKREHQVAKRQAGSGQYNELSWVSHSGRFGNRNTGISQAGQPAGGQNFGGAYLQKAGDIAVLTVDLATPLPAPQDISFDYYENTQDMILKACCDTACTDVSVAAAKADSRKWQQKSQQCPAGTKQVSFRCENSGKETGACGLDNIKVASCPAAQ